MKKLRIGILFGGKSAEHEISLLSAKNVLEALDKERFEPVKIKIAKDGTWDQSLLSTIDVAFPVLHGPLGEDGTIQGLLRLANVPFVGSGVLASAVGMDKDVTKRLLRDAGIAIPRFLACTAPLPFAQVEATLGLPCFVKPANMGSSVGVGKVHDEAEYDQAMAAAFQYDRKVLIEEAVTGMEVECAVLGNDDPQASLPGKIIPNAEFYSYEAKYLDENGALLEIPAQLPEKTIADIQRTALAVFKTLGCEGMARVDMFVREDGAVIVNEVNTIPGFTNISMYPKLWEASGVTYTELVSRLIDLAIERHEKEQLLRTTYA